MKQVIKNVFAYGYLFFLPLISFAQGAGPGTPGGAGPGNPGGAGPGTPGGAGSPSTGTLQNPLNDTSICSLFKDVLHITIQLAIPIIILFLVYAGFKFVVARGNSTKLQEARNNLFYTIIGIGLFLGAWTLASVLVGTINTLQPNSVSSC